jgi:hypothetical protein
VCVYDVANRHTQVGARPATTSGVVACVASVTTTRTTACDVCARTGPRRIIPHAGPENSLGQSVRRQSNTPDDQWFYNALGSPALQPLPARPPASQPFAHAPHGWTFAGQDSSRRSRPPVLPHTSSCSSWRSP